MRYRQPTTARLEATGADRRPTSSVQTPNTAGRSGTRFDEASPYTGCQQGTQIRSAAGQEMVDCLIALHEASPDFVTVADGEGRFVYMNASARHMLGIGSPARPAVCELEDAYPVSTYTRILNEAVPCLLRGETWLGEGAMLDGYGREIPVSMVMSAYRTQDAGIRFISCIARDISSHKQREQLLLYQAKHDPATALPNRAALYELLTYAVRYGQRYGHSAAALFLDVDDFKHLNDAVGHVDADRVIRDIADRLAQCIRKVDIVGRYGGDEFVIVLSAVNDRTEIQVVLKKIMATFKDPFETAGRSVRLTCSIGVATYPGDGSDAQTLLRHANQAMFRVKSRGKNGCCFHGSDDIQPRHGEGSRKSA